MQIDEIASEIFQRLPSGTLSIIMLGVAILLVARVIAGFLDWWRIANYVRRHGGQLLSCVWWPFGPGWIGEKRDRIYKIKFYDRDGATHRAYCKTSLLTGVYFTQDRIVGAKSAAALADPPHESLIAENARLREENRRLRAALKNPT